MENQVPDVIEAEVTQEVKVPDILIFKLDWTIQIGQEVSIKVEGKDVKHPVTLSIAGNKILQTEAKAQAYAEKINQSAECLGLQKYLSINLTEGILE